MMASLEIFALDSPRQQKAGVAEMQEKLRVHERRLSSVEEHSDSSDPPLVYKMDIFLMTSV
jgi:hypothetical protein